MRIFAAGIATETNTFCPIPTSLGDFLVVRGRDVVSGSVENPSLDLNDPWGRQAEARGDTFVFSLMAWAQPSGITVQSAYEGLRDEVLGDLRAAMPVDVVLLMLHGAMVAHGYEDCEEDIIRCVRSVVGPTTVIGVELDLHCHLRPAKIDGADLVITYKEYPHTDIADRARELFELAVAAGEGRIRPIHALFDCRMVGLYPTSREPLRHFVEAMTAAERRPGVLSVSFGHGFQFADVPHVGAKMLVVTDNDLTLASEVAQELGGEVYRLRRQIGFETLSFPLDEALTRARTSKKTPVVVADQSDNTGGGAPGDATFALCWLLDHDVNDVALAIFYDPVVVQIAKRAGVGTRLLPIRLGGKMGPSSGEPVDLQVQVLSLRERYMHVFPQQSGEPMLYPAGDVVAVRYKTIDIIVSSERCQCFSPSVFADMGIDLAHKRVVIVKSVQHFYRAFAAIAGEIIYMAAPGAVVPDPRQIPYRRLNTDQLYPWREDPLGR